MVSISRAPAIPTVVRKKNKTTEDIKSAFVSLLVEVYARRQMLLELEVTGCKEINSLCLGLGIMGCGTQGSQYRRVTFGE